MRSWMGCVMAAAVVCIIAAACGTSARPQPAPGPAAGAAVDTIQSFNDAMVRRLLEGIAGRDTEPADHVFDNVHILNDVNARTFLLIMNIGYARALGVRCSHCHVIGNFASDEKRPKRAAREMARMHRMINQELAKMDNLATPKEQNRAINCATCHRGMVNPSER